MRGWTIPIGTIFGVEVRIHSFFILLLALSISYANILEVGSGRGFGLGLMLLFAVALREFARALAAAWYRLGLRSILLLPTGGLSNFAASAHDAHDAHGEDSLGTPSSDESIPAAPEGPRASLPGERAVALAGPLANLAFGLIVGGLILAVSPQVNLVQLPWITPVHMLRALVWLNLLLGAVNLLPVWPLDGATIFRRTLQQAPAAQTPLGRFGIGPLLAILLIIAGMLIPNMWLMMIGIFVLIAAQWKDQGSAAEPAFAAAETFFMRDVMLVDYTILSASATLEDAMLHATHTLQDVFPVVRGGNLVGAVSRQNIADALETSGNSYVQGIMTRSFSTAQPGDPLLKTLRRVMAGRTTQSAQLVPIVDREDGERIVGIVTPQILQRAMGLLHQTRRMRQASDLRKEQDRL